MNSIFKTYTGNALLNNALMTIEALGKLKNVTEITIGFLHTLYKDMELLALNKRLKSYTMLFTKNGPLHNDKANGESVYNSLFCTILDSFEVNGDKVCEISGLRFSTPFEKIYIDSLRKIGFSEKEIQKKDLTINRTWFPLIGGLGSDAQALPQARFTVQIHPICIPILQFLPLSALLYKGGVLLIDSSNFDFARSFVENNVRDVGNRIQVTSSTESIENIKDYSKGNYLLKAIDILKDKEMEDDYSDLNLWSFSNSGTGAHCEIERVPNGLIKKLMRMLDNPNISNEVNSILGNQSSAFRFMENLEGNAEWYGLYPNVFGSGKKKVEYNGVSVAFLETYFKEIGSSKKIEYAKYIAWLIGKYTTSSFAKYLDKRDAWSEKEFRIDLFAVLVKAAENGEWDLHHHIQILDDPSQVPVQNNFYTLHKVIHFYHWKNTFSSDIPSLTSKNSAAQKVSEWLVGYIQNDTKFDGLQERLLTPKEYLSVTYAKVFNRASAREDLSIETILYALYKNDEKQNIYGGSAWGINSLLRIFFSQPIQADFEMNGLEVPENVLSTQIKQWIESVKEFAVDYQAYYFDKFENKETGKKPFDKFLDLVGRISDENSKFLKWFYEAVGNTNEFLKKKEVTTVDKWTDTLLYPANGGYALGLARFAIKFSLLKQQHKITIH